MFLGTKEDYVYPMLRIGEDRFWKKPMVLTILYIRVAPKCIMIIERSIGGWFENGHSRVCY